MAKLRGGEAFQMYFGAKPELFRIAGDLRKSMTQSERRLWNCLKNRQVLGFKFRRQHPVYVIILDFFCYDAKLSIELDGAFHNERYQKERDIERTSILKNFGIKELRFSNWEVENEIEKVLFNIEDYLMKTSLVKDQVSLPPGGGRAGDGG